jgi:hypothetical protein
MGVALCVGFYISWFVNGSLLALDPLHGDFLQMCAAPQATTGAVLHLSAPELSVTVLLGRVALPILGLLWKHPPKKYLLSHFPDTLNALGLQEESRKLESMQVGALFAPDV